MPSAGKVSEPRVHVTRLSVGAAIFFSLRPLPSILMRNVRGLFLERKQLAALVFKTSEKTSSIEQSVVSRTVCIG